MSNFNKNYMKLALKEAEKAAVKREVPIGAIIVHSEFGIIAKQHNLVESNNNPTAHAELIAINEACKNLKSRYLNECTIYSTLEPCAMCAYAISLSRMQKLIFAATDKKAGAIENGIRLFYNQKSCYSPEIYGNIMSQESIILLQNFFNSLRKDNK